MRKIVVIFLMLLSLVAWLWHNVEERDQTLYQTSGYTYKLDFFDQAILVNFQNEQLQSCIEVPSFLDGYPVVEIQQHALNLQNVLVLKLPSTLKKMEKNACYHCDSVTALTLPADCESQKGFEGLTNLRWLSLLNSDSNQMLEFSSTNNWINDNHYLEKVIIAEGIEKISDYSFNDLPYLQEIVLPSTLKQIGQQSLNQLDGLQQLILPNNLIKIGLSSLQIDAEILVYDNENVYETLKEQQLDVKLLDFHFEQPQYQLVVGETKKLELKQSRKTKLSFTSSDPTILSIDEFGYGLAKQAGTVEVICDDGYQKTSCMVEIVTEEDKEFYRLEIGQSLTIQEKITEVKNEAGAFEITNQTVQAISKGEVVVKVLDDQKNEKQYVLQAYQPIKQIEVEKPENPLIVGNQKQLVIQTKGETINYTDLSLISSDETIVTVDQTGLLTALQAGQVTITVTSIDHPQIQESVMIEVMDNQIECLNAPVISMPTKSYQLTCSCMNGEKLKYYSLDSSIAKIDENGKVDALQAKETQIVVYSSQWDCFQLVDCVIYDAFSYGIDLSEWNGRNHTLKTFETIKKQGIDFVYLRACYEDDYMDPCFQRNYQLAKQANLAVGAYHYITSVNVEQVEKEAEFMLETIKGKQFEYPIMLDIETSKHKLLPIETLNQLINRYCQIMNEHGYEVIVYSYANLLRRYYGPYPLAVANWNVKAPSIQQDYRIWQFSASGCVNGLSGHVDLNLCFYDYPSYIKENNLNGY